jgi:Phage-related protein
MVILRINPKGENMGIIKDFINYRKIKYSPLFSIGGEWQTGGGELENSDIIGSIENCIASNVGKLMPQIVRSTADGLNIKDDYLAKMLSLRWSPELSAYDALYRIASDVVRKSNSFSVIFYSKDYSRIERIVPITMRSYRIFEDDNDNLIFRFTWDKDGKEYTLPYAHIIHIKARFNKKRFLGTPPDAPLKNTLELMDITGQGLKNAVKNSTGLRGYIKYTNFLDDDTMKEKVAEFKSAYMTAENTGGIAGLDSTAEFRELSARTPNIPVLQSQFLRDNIYRYYNVNENILTSKFDEQEWNAFYESVIEPIALQLSLEFTFKILSERERGHGNKVIFTANRLQYATLRTRSMLGGALYDRGIITINEYRELLYYEPIEDGDVRMVSLNYVKTDDQTLYQTGQQDTKETIEEAKPLENKQLLTLAMNKIYVKTVKKGGEKENGLKGN